MNQVIFEFDILKKNTKTLFNSGFKYIIGCDEAGRGPAAGPLYVAGACFKDYNNIPEILYELNDSKKLSEKTREKLYPVIKECCYFSIQKIEIETIEKINILNASLYGMKLASEEIISKLKDKNILVLVDGNKQIKNFNYPQEAIIKGDSTSASIAAASVLAKVERDNFMIELDKKYPNYNFKKNKGYLTKEHIEAIKKYGITDIHRRSYLTKICNYSIHHF